MPQAMRRHTRDSLHVDVVLGWTDEQGNSRRVRGKCLDVSEVGMQIETMEAVAVRAYIVVKAVKLGLDGSASVRYCTRTGIRFRIGVEFSGGLRYRPQN